MIYFINSQIKTSGANRSNTCRAWLLLILAACTTLSCATQNCDLDTIYRTAESCEEGVCPPAAPTSGPGSGVSPHKGVDIIELEEGMFDAYRSVVYLPASPSPKTAPVLLFLHGYFDAKPKPYDAMLRHYARKGYIVIYPSYGNALAPKAWVANAEGAMNRAIKYLQTNNSVQPDLEQVAYVGHSIGSILALHLAEKQAAAKAPLIPQPKLIIAMDGAGIVSPAYPFLSIADLSHIPKTTQMMLIMAEETFAARLEDKKKCLGDEQETPKPCNGFAVNRLAFTQTPQIPDEQKAAFVIPSDMRGEKGLRSEHNGAQGYCGMISSKPIDGIDTWGYWSLTVSALNQVLMNEPTGFEDLRAGKNRLIGKWSDGKAAKSAISIDTCLKGGACPDQG